MEKSTPNGRLLYAKITRFLSPFECRLADDDDKPSARGAGWLRSRLESKLYGQAQVCLFPKYISVPVAVTRFGVISSRALRDSFEGGEQLSRGQICGA